MCAEIRLDDRLWEDLSELRREMARAGLITKSPTHGWRLRTYGWQVLVALSAMAEGDPNADQPGFTRAILRVNEGIFNADD